MTVAKAASRRLLFAMLSAGNFVIGMGAFVVIGIVTPVADGLGVSKASAGVILTAYAIAYALASPLAVAVTGRMARRDVLSVALLVFLAGTVISALSQSLLMLTLSRVLVAIGAALYTPAAAGVAVAISSAESRGRALATVFGGLTLAQVVGVPAGAWLAYRWGWNATFWAVALLAAAGLALLYAAIPRDVPSQPSSVATILKALADWRLSFAIAFTATFLGAIYLVFTYFGPLIEASLGANPELRTGFLVLFGIGAVAGNYIGGFLTDRIGSIRTLAILCLGQAAIMPLFSIIPSPILPFAVLVGVWSAFGWSFMAPQQARLTRLAPQAVAMVLALNAAMIYVGIAIGSAASAGVLQFQGLGALGVAGGVAMLVAFAHLMLSRCLSGP